MNDGIIRSRGETLDVARKLAKAQIPDGAIVLSEAVLSDGKPQVITGLGSDAEAAFGEALVRGPVGARIVEKKLLSDARRGCLSAHGFDEAEAKRKALHSLAGDRSKGAKIDQRIIDSIELTRVDLKKNGRKGLWGVGRKPHEYEVEFQQPAVVEVTAAPEALFEIHVLTGTFSISEEFGGGKDDFSAELERFRQRYSLVPKSLITHVESLCKDKEKNAEELRQETSVAALIAGAIAPGEKYGSGGRCCHNLGFAKPKYKHPDVAIALVLLWGGESYDEAMQALIILDEAAKAAEPYLLVAFSKEDNPHVALCLANIGASPDITPRIANALASFFRPGYSPLYDEMTGYWKGFAVPQLLVMGDVGREVLLALVHEGVLDGGHTKQVLEQFGIQDPVATDCATVLSFREEDVQNTYKDRQKVLDAAIRLEESDDSRAVAALEHCRDKLAQVRIYVEVGKLSTTPEEMDGYRDKFLSDFQKLPVVRDDLLDQFWRWLGGPVDTICGAEALVDTVIAKVQEETHLIRTHTVNLKSVTLAVEPCFYFDGASKSGSSYTDTSIKILLWRRFRDGDADFHPHYVVRIADETFKFAHRPLKLRT